MISLFGKFASTAWAVRAALALLCLLSAGLATAEDSAGYTVEIRGAGKLTSLLNDYLEIRRHEHDANVDDDELRRLAGTGVQQIRDLLATEGYFAPKVTHQVQTEEGRRFVRYEVDPGPPIVVDKVDLHFSGEVASGPHADEPRIARLKRRWKLDPGMRFRQADWDASKNALLADLINRGFPAAKISASQARIDPDKRSAQLSVDVESGPLFTFGDLKISGLQRYSRERIDSLNPIKPGEVYSQEKLTELQSRLQDTGYFRTAFATIDVDPTHPHDVPVRVDLAENERHRLSLGGGFSTDAGPRAQMRWLDRQFLGHDWRLESDIHGDRLDQVAGADLYFPARGNGWYPSVGVHAERSDVENERVHKLRNDWRMTSPDKLNEQTWAVSYLTDRQYLPGDFVNNRQALVLGYTYTRRRLDSLLNPRRGYVASVELDGGPRGLINQANIARTVMRANWLITLAPRWHAQLRGEFGKVMGAGRELVPDDLLFRTGGDQTVRGYAYNSLGVSQNGAIVGGTIEAVASAELVYYFLPAWGAAIFHDAGNAADSWHDFVFAHGTGVGLRWRSPIGPVNVDFAYGHATHEPRLHFSIGYGF